MPTLNLWLIRHGETNFNRGILTDDPKRTVLSPLGREQVLAAAKTIPFEPNHLIVSPLPRTRETAAIIQTIWPKPTPAYWPIFEFHYVNPTRLQSPDRVRWIEDYWHRADPEYRDCEDTESFADFLDRVSQFHHQVCQLEGFAIAVGHGHFFKAFLMGLQSGYQASPDWMRRFRAEERKHPISNGEIIRLCFNS